MPKNCILWSAIRCPYCGMKLEDRAHQVCFEWGAVGESYSIGEKVRWFTDKHNKVIPSLKRTENDRWNCGNPMVGDVLLFDPEVLQFPPTRRLCSTCGQPYAAIAVCIREEHVESVKVFTPNELEKLLGDSYPQVIPGCILWYPNTARQQEIDLWDMQPNGRYLPRLDWYDAPLESFLG